MKKVVAICCLILFACGSAIAVPSGTVVLGSHGNGLSGQATITGGGHNGRVHSGIYSYVASSPTGDGVLVPNWGFCIEIPQSPVNGTHVVDFALEDYSLPAAYTTPMGLLRANLIRELWAANFNPAWVTTPNKDAAGAFGCAIWEIIYETDVDTNSKLILDISSGTGFKAVNLTGGAAMTTLANGWLSALTGTGPTARLLAVSNQGGQDFVTTPEPATIGLLGIGFLAVLKRKRS